MDRESSLSLSQAVMGAAVIIALAIGGSYAYQQRFVKKNMPALVKQAIEDMTPNPQKMAPVGKNDHVLGKADAPVKLVVYTDLECPFCKTFHESIAELKDNYIKDGKLALVYRNLPLDQLHSKARAEAEASECAAKLGGNEAYWTFVDKIFAATPSNDGLDMNLLPQFATQAGIDRDDFEKCRKDKAIAATVAAQAKNGEEAGAQGTPYPIVVLGDEVKGALRGALPAEEMKSLVDQLINEEKPAEEKPAE